MNLSERHACQCRRRDGEKKEEKGTFKLTKRRRTEKQKIKMKKKRLGSDGEEKYTERRKKESIELDREER